MPTTYLCTSFCATESALSITFFATFYVIRIILVKGGFFPRYFKSQDVFNPFLCGAFDRLESYAGIPALITILQNLQNTVVPFKCLLTTPNNVLPLHLKQTFPPIIWIFTEGEGNLLRLLRLPFKIFSTLPNDYFPWLTSSDLYYCQLFSSSFNISILWRQIFKAELFWLVCMLELINLEIVTSVTYVAIL